MKGQLATKGDYLSVSELSKALSTTLERNHPEVFFQGEISSVSRPSSGHLYFSLKDDRSQLAAVMWRGMTTSLKFNPEPGLAVVCHGKPNIYNVSGKLQIAVHFMSLAGEGLLQKKFLELKEKLEKEGLFAPERKREIPFLPRAIGVVSSKSGAVIHDIMVRLRERMPSIPVSLVDVRVQGEGASAEIAEAIQYLNELNNVDVIIVARGGGSLEDLWAFNEERTVRAIFASRIPVVSGVGHEVDITLADLVADVRAPTPTAAAEMVVPIQRELLKALSEIERRLSDIDRWLAPLIQRVDDLTLRLEGSIRSLLERAALRMQEAATRVKLLEPHKLLTLFFSRIDGLRERLYANGQAALQRSMRRLETIEMRLVTAGQERVRTASHTLKRLTATLHAISPRRVLERGYSIVEHNGKVVARASQVKPNDSITVTLFEGSLAATVRGAEDA